MYLGLLLIHFESCAFRYGTSVSQSIYGPSAKPGIYKTDEIQGGSKSYSADRKYGINVMFSIEYVSQV